MGGWQYTNSFVVQFQANTDMEAGSLTGRIEHVASSRAAHFKSLDELLSFVNQVLLDMRMAHQHDESNRPVSEVAIERPTRE